MMTCNPLQPSSPRLRRRRAQTKIGAPSPLLVLVCIAFLWGLGPQSASASNPSGGPTPSPNVVNLGIAVRTWTANRRPFFLNDTTFVYLECEADGNVDLNGDGDRSDAILRGYDTERRESIDFGLAIFRFFAVDEDSSWLPFLVDEADQDNTDFNRDGDTRDWVVHLLHRRTYEIRNLELVPISESDVFVVNRDTLAFLVPEREHGRDLNRDGDRQDRILHTYNATTDVLTNLGLQPTGPISMSDDLLAFRAWENYTRTDLNGDGDLLDSVLHVFDLSKNTLKNLRYSAGIVQAHNGAVTFRVFETSHGNQDLNRDGDLVDRILMTYDSATGQITNHRHAVTFIWGGRNYGAYGASEWQSGRTDLNNDGDTLDIVMHVFDGNFQQPINLGGDITNGDVRVVDDAMAFHSEDNGTYSIKIFRPGRRVRTVGSSGPIETLSPGGLLMTAIRETDRDLNEDGDLDDSVVHHYDPRSGLLTNLRLAHAAGYSPRLRPWTSSHDDGLIAFPITEVDQGWQDFNSDGDVCDWIGYVVNLQTCEADNLNLPTDDLSVRRNTIVFSVPESDQEFDLNGDRDIADSVLHLATLNFNAQSGNVNSGAGEVRNVLTINGSSGGLDRLVEFQVPGPLEMSISNPPAAPAGTRSRYVVYAWDTIPTPSTWAAQPFGIGYTALPTPLSGGDQQPRIIWNTLGRPRHLGHPSFASDPAPSVFFRRPGIVRMPAQFYIQGLIEDPEALGRSRVSVTNGVTAVPMFGGR